MTSASKPRLFHKDIGHGTPLVLVHEFASDIRQWDLQLEVLSNHCRCIAFNARGYPPSEVPERDEDYDQDLAADDIARVMDEAGVERAFVCGVSMGAAAALHFGLRHPDRALGLVVSSAGSGALPSTRQQFIRETLAASDLIKERGMASFAEALATGPTRLQLRRKNPMLWEKFRADLASHSAIGSAQTLRNCQAKRASLHDLGPSLQALAVPVLLIVGDEDDPVLETNLFLKRNISRCGLRVFPQTGHAVNLEEPAMFNAAVLSFMAEVEQGGWPAREAATQSERQFPIAVETLTGEHHGV